MANEFVARKGLIVSGSTRMTDSLEVDTSISASSFTGSFIGDGSGLTGIDGFPFTGSAEISGSLTVDGPITASFFVGDGSGLTGVDGFPFTGSAEISGSLNVDGPVTASFFVGDGSGLTNVTAELTTVTTFGQSFTSETSITVTHNLDTNAPLVQVYDDNNEQIIPTKIKILNNDEVLIEFPVEVSGTVVVGKGGDFIESPIQQYEESFTSESSIIIYHLLDTTSPIVQVYDENDEQIIPFKIKILNEDSVLLEFSPATTGKVVVAKGGHIIDAIGFSYRAQEFTNTSLVEVSHGFGTDAPIVQVYDDTGLQIIPQEIRIIDENILEVQFSSNRSGKIAVSKGGHILQGGSTTTDTSGSFTGSFSGSFIGDGSGLSGIDGFPFTGSAEISGSLDVDGTITATTFIGDGSGLTGVDGFPFTGSAEISGSLEVAGPVTASFFVGDGSGITNLGAAGLTYKVQDFNNTDNVIVTHNFDTLAPIVQVYDDTGSQILPDDIRVLDENSVEIIFSENYSGKVAVSKGGHIVTTENGTSGSFTGSFTATEDIIPSVTDQFDLGSPTNRFKDIYLSGSTIFLGNIKLSESEDGNLKVVDSSEKEFSIIEIDTGSINSRLDDLENFSSSLDDTFATDDELFTTQSLLQGDIDTRLLTSSFNEYTGSTDIRIDNLEIESGSIRSTLNNYTSSADLRLGSLEIESGSVRTDFSNYTSSTDLRIDALEVESGSIRTTLNNYTSSADLRLDSLEIESGSIRGTFNNFTSSVDAALTFNNEDIVANGNITVTGDLLVQGTQSIFNTEQFSVENNVIELNTAGAIKGGILVGDITEPSELSGSLLWDGVNDHWIAGISGSEQRIILENTFNNYTSSIDTKISSLETESGSIRNVFNSYTSSADLRLGALETESGSIRTTFNNFTGSLGNIVTQNSSSITITGGSINGTSIGATSASTGAFTDLSYTGTLTGGTGAITIGTNQFVKEAGGNVGIGTSSPQFKLEVNGSFAATTKSFLIDHPTKPGKKLRYGSLEGPENGVYVRGRCTGNVIELPDYWSELVDGDSVTVQLTTVGTPQTDLYVLTVGADQIHIYNPHNTQYFYFVQAERKDTDKLVVEVDYTIEEK
jgi:hypothetical protein